MHEVDVEFVVNSECIGVVLERVPLQQQRLLLCDSLGSGIVMAEKEAAEAKIRLSLYSSGSTAPVRLFVRHRTKCGWQKSIIRDGPG